MEEEGARDETRTQCDSIIVEDVLFTRALPNAEKCLIHLNNSLIHTFSLLRSILEAHFQRCLMSRELKGRARTINRQTKTRAALSHIPFHLGSLFVISSGVNCLLIRFSFVQSRLNYEANFFL